MADKKPPSKQGTLKSIMAKTKDLGVEMGTDVICRKAEKVMGLKKGDITPQDVFNARGALKAGAKKKTAKKKPTKKKAAKKTAKKKTPKKKATKKKTTRKKTTKKKTATPKKKTTKKKRGPRKTKGHPSFADLQDAKTFVQKHGFEKAKSLIDGLAAMQI